jgi:hypothetical protein
VKYAASLLGKCAADTRLLLAPLMEGSRETGRRAIQLVGLLN